MGCVRATDGHIGRAPHPRLRSHPKAQVGCSWPKRIIIINNNNNNILNITCRSAHPRNVILLLSTETNCAHAHTQHLVKGNYRGTPHTAN